MSQYLLLMTALPLAPPSPRRKASRRAAGLAAGLFSAALFVMCSSSANASSWFPTDKATSALQVASPLTMPSSASAQTSLLVSSQLSQQPSLQPTLRLDRHLALSVDDPLSTGQAESGLNASKVSRSRYAVPALASAVLPGTGEIATGHFWNGIPLLAAEVAIWIGYFHYNDEGSQLRADYEVFVDAHWSPERWQTNLRTWYNVDDPNTPPPNWYNEDFPYNCDCSPPFIPKEEDPQEYYENAGKYRHFRPGWDDWAYNPNDPLGSDSASNRAEYISMRNRSNDNFDNAGTMLGLAVLTRAISVTQTLWLVNRDVKKQNLELRPTYGRRKGAGMKLTWSY